jgi:hypothetical protein
MIDLSKIYIAEKEKYLIPHHFMLSYTEVKKLLDIGFTYSHRSKGFDSIFEINNMKYSATIRRSSDDDISLCISKNNSSITTYTIHYHHIMKPNDMSIDPILAHLKFFYLEKKGIDKKTFNEFVSEEKGEISNG